MKAYEVYEKDALEYSVLVFAKTRAQAIYTAIKDSSYAYQSDWVDMRARRRKEFDEYYPIREWGIKQVSMLIEDDNSKLPFGAPKFYK